MVVVVGRAFRLRACLHVPNLLCLNLTSLGGQKSATRVRLQDELADLVALAAPPSSYAKSCTTTTSAEVHDYFEAATRVRLQLRVFTGTPASQSRRPARIVLV